MFLRPLEIHSSFRSPLLPPQQPTNELLEAFEERLPGLRGRARTTLRGVDWWQLTDRVLRGRESPLLHAVQVLEQGSGDLREVEAARWDATYWLAQLRAFEALPVFRNGVEGGEAEQGAHPDRPSREGEAALFEGEAFDLARDIWPGAAFLPPLTSERSPEFFAFPRAGWSFGLECKCIDPMSEEEATRLVSALRKADAVLRGLVDRRQRRWLRFDLDETERVSLDGVGLSTVEHPLWDLPAAGGLALFDIGIPSEILTLEAYWADEDVGESGGPRVRFGEAKVTVGGSWPSIASRLEKNLIKANAKHGVARWGVTLIRVREPGFGRCQSLLERLWHEVVVPLAQRNKLGKTDVVCLTMMSPSLRPRAERRRLMSPHAGSITFMPAKPDTHFQGVLGALSEGVPRAAFARLPRVPHASSRDE